MRVKRTERIWIHGTDGLRTLAHLSKNLYNEANYAIRQEFFNNGKWIGYNDLNLLMKDSENYRSLPAQTAQQTLRLLDKSWKSFFKAMKSWKKHPEKFPGKPKPPHYKEKDGEHMLVFTNQQCRIRDGTLKFPKIMGMEVKTRLENISLREVRIIPEGMGYEVEIVYEKDIKDAENTKTQRIMGIDIGVRNLVTIGNNIPEEGIAVRAGLLKSINQFYNKENARLRSINDQQDRKTMTRRLQRLIITRNRKIRDIMHKVSKSIVEYAKSRNIDTIVIGHNEGWKQSVNIGHRNNQNFVQLPFNTLIQQIRYKAEEHGINVIVQDESHTSKCSFLDNESVEHHDSYVGRRIRRGVFQSANGKLIHADLNGSYNIIRKAIPEAFANGIEGVGLHPRSLSIRQMITSKGGC